MAAPTIVAYAGPKVSMYVSSVSLFAASSSGTFPWSNTQNLVGAPDGLKSSVSLTVSSNTGWASDSILLKFSPPPALRNARVNAFQYTLKAVQCDESVGEKQGILLSLATAAGVKKGADEGVHEFTGTTPGDYGTATYFPDAVPGPEATSLFTAGAGAGAALGINCATLNDIGGIIARAYNSGGTNTLETVTTQFDAFQLTCFITPADAGTRVYSLAAASVAGADAATVGIAIDPAWQTETAWTTPANALTVDGTRASCGNLGADSYPQTQFLVYSFSGGQLGGRVRDPACELRCTWRGRFDGTNSGVGAQYDYALPGEMYLATSTGTILLRAKADGVALHDCMNMKIAGYNSPFTQSERDRALVMNVGSLTVAQLQDIQDNGCKIGVRFNLFNPDQASAAALLYVNGATFTLSTNPGRSRVVRTGRKDRTRRARR